MKFIPTSQWGFNILKNKQLLIAGPCSAESRDQMLSIAKDLALSGTQILRAGVWKPRSRPGSFQGIGLPGLEWMKEAA